MVTSSSIQVGAKASLQGQAWWSAFVDQTSTKVVVSSATLTSASLNLVLKNTGNATADVQTVIITPISGSASAIGLTASIADWFCRVHPLEQRVTPSFEHIAGSSTTVKRRSSSKRFYFDNTQLHWPHITRIRPEEHPGNHRNRLGTAVPHHLHGCKHLHFHDSGGSIEPHLPSLFFLNSVFFLWNDRFKRVPYDLFCS